MPYVKVSCSWCDCVLDERYHNVKKCPKCGNMSLRPVRQEPIEEPSGTTYIDQEIEVSSNTDDLARDGEILVKFGKVTLSLNAHEAFKLSASLHHEASRLSNR